MRPITALIRSCLQVHNIGDMAQGPGLIAAIRRSGAPIQPVLWPHGATAEDLSWFRDAYPDVEIVTGSAAPGHEVRRDVLDAFDRADVLVHGSQGGAIYLDEIEAWCAHTAGRDGRARPYGFAGITVDPWITLEGAGLGELRSRARQGPSQRMDERARRLLQEAAFVFGRDSISVTHLERAGVASLRGFGADSTFGFDLADTTRADALLSDLGLIDEAFICLVPRLRYTPYAELWGTAPTAVQLAQQEQSAIHREEEFGIIRDWIRSDPGGPPVLVCPEMSYAPAVGRAEFNRTTLGEAARRVHHVPEFWDPAVAAGVYARAQLVVSMECHSPILALAAGTPALYLRQPTDRAKGAMFGDVGLGDWVLEIDSMSLDELQSKAHDLFTDADGTVAQRLAACAAAATTSIETIIQEMLAVTSKERSTSTTA